MEQCGSHVIGATSTRPLVTFTNSTVQGGCAPQTCGTADPLFVNAPGVDHTPGTFDDDIRLQAGSPATGQGASLAPTDAPEGYEPPMTVYLTGTSGYRMLALPTGTYNDLLGPLWTQGFPGADSEAGACSVLQWDEASGDFEVGYVCLPDQDAAAVRGAGLFAYVYQDDDNNASTGPGVFPKVLTVTGAAAEAPFSAFPLTYTVPATPTAPAWEWGWNLLGNPLTDAFDWDLTERTGGLTETVYVYDPNYFGGDYRTWTADLGGDLPDGVVPAFQGFFAKAAGASPGLEVPSGGRRGPGAGRARAHGLWRARRL